MEVVTFLSVVLNPDVWFSDLPSAGYPEVVFTELLMSVVA
jgi:hypothetical protein